VTDYTPNNDYSVKDGLAPGDPEKDILGSDIDSELDEISTAIASKFDATDLATQAQAEAGVSNTTLMTPLRVSQFIGGGAGGGGDAGGIADIGALNDPNDDRILFWDDSGSLIDWLDIGSGLDITLTTLSVNEAAVDHDALLNFVGNEHVDHTAVTITAGVGLSYSVGGTNISADATIDLDINELTTETTLDLTNDFLAFYDGGSAVLRKVNVGALVGDILGDGKFFRNATQAFSAATEATVVFNTTSYDDLTRGTFSTATGEYTATAVTRIWIHAQVTVESVDESQYNYLSIEVDGVEKARTVVMGNEDNLEDKTVIVGTNLDLPNGTEVVRVRLETESAQNSVAGESQTQVSIMELV
jgi:hypothetical protein